MKLIPERIDFPEEYCGYCCHYHEPGMACGVEYPPVSGELIGDVCTCNSSLEERQRILDE